MDHNSYKTIYPTRSDLSRDWLLLDASAQPLGRLASRIANLIRGKHKPSFAPHLDTGDRVVVINAERVAMSGKKWTDRVIFSHSGYPGSQRRHTPLSIRTKHPERLIEHAVRGMLPKNRLGRKVFHNLHVYRGEQHPYASQKPKKIIL